MLLTPNELKSLKSALNRLTFDLHEAGAPLSLVTRANDAVAAVEYAQRTFS